MVSIRWLGATAPLLLLAVRVNAVDSDFSFYPENSQSCLNQASDNSNCNGASSTQALNKCLCSNTGNFITNTAKCLGKNDSKDVATVYSTMSGACSDSNTPISMGHDKFVSIADDAENSTKTTSKTSQPSTTMTHTSATVTTTDGGQTVTVTPSNSPGDDDSDDGSDGLSTAATAGIAVGASAVGLAAIAGAVFLFMRRRRSQGEESNPMLPQQHSSMYAGPTTFPPRDPLSAFPPDSEAGWRAKSTTPGYSPRHSPSYISGTPSLTDPTRSSPNDFARWSNTSTVPSHGWSMVGAQANGMGGHGQYSGPYAPPSSEVISELPPNTAVLPPGQGTENIFEMDSSQPAEMQGSIPSRPQDAHSRPFE